MAAVGAGDCLDLRRAIRADQCDDDARQRRAPSSEELAALFETIFRRYPTASAIGFATIPATDEGGLSLAAVNRMIAGAVRGVLAREKGVAKN
ncbi:MAG TPA: hypothetical protein VN716_04260 [Vicinamibacterales bacterium]|nr:hypothetical protein [Vicinamibacterales bacterium]